MINDNKMNNNHLSQVKINNLCPLLAMISAGKTSLLKVIFDIDFLVSSSGIGTKFVNIIRYKPDIGKSPKFFHLILKNKGEGNYEFYKDENSEISGKREILEKNKELNDEFKNREVPYEELFYMIEVGEANFIDKEYLKYYDLVDIPGVSEYKESDKNIIRKKYSPNIEEEMKDYNPSDEKNYLTEIFKIIKNYINNGIILFSIDNYQLVENYRIIGKFQKVINKPIENFLILLNKIDKSEDREFDLNNLYSKITEFFPNLKEFNFTKNIIVPCSTMQLENELKMDKSFKHLIYFHYLNFLMNSKQKANKEGNNKTFIDFIKKFINKKKISKKNFTEKIYKVINSKNIFNLLSEIKEIFKDIRNNHLDDNFNLGIRDDDFEQNEIKIILENIEEEEEFNISDLDGNIIILFFYSEFINNKLIPQKSRGTLTIMRYFTLEYIESCNKEKELKKIKKEQEVLNGGIKLTEKMNKLYTEYTNEENLKLYKNYLVLSSKILDSSNLIYIPLFGETNAGKSTILNGLIGYSILPAQKNECTKKGILIRYWNRDYPVIRKTRFINKDNKYYFQSEKETIAANIEDIQKILTGLNGKFIEKEEDFFYEIDIKIKFVYDSEMEDSLKERICFIDLPGFGTNNNFENLDIYSHLINACDIFIYVVFNLKIKENNNHEMLNNFFNEVKKEKNISIKEFIKKFLFVINCEKEQDTSKKSLLQAKNDIIEIIPDLNNENINDLNVCFFNAKYYEVYMFKYNYYNSFEFLIDHEYMGYLKLFENFNKGQIDRLKGGNFNKYFMELLKSNIKKDIVDKFNEKEIRINKQLKEEVNKEIKKYQFPFKEKEIDLISKYISFAKNNISKSDLLDESNIEIIKMYLLIHIKNIKSKEEFILNNKIDDISKQIFNFYEEYKKVEVNKFYIDKLKIYLNSSIGILKSTKLFYIPIFGLEKSGKSTILNCIIGNNYLPTNDICTKKGILIRYWNKNYSVIRKSRFKKDNNIYKFEPEEEIIAKGFEDIRIILEGTNDKYTQKEEDFFYEIDIKIKLIHELPLDNSLKEKICFIEFPKNFIFIDKDINSFNFKNECTENKILENNSNYISNDFYYHLIGSCNIFLFVFFDFKKNKDKNLNILKYLYYQILEYRGISVQEFMNKILLIINYNEKEYLSSNLLDQFSGAKLDIYKMINSLDNKTIYNLNICFFNANYYIAYLFKLKYYNSTDLLIKHEHKKYLKYHAKKLIHKPFNKYLIDKLKENIKIDIPYKFNEKEVTMNEQIIDSMKTTLKTHILSFSQKEFNLLIKYISFCKEKISKSKYLLNSNVDDFRKNLFIFILKTKKIEDEEIKNNFKNGFEIFEKSILDENNEDNYNFKDENENYIKNINRKYENIWYAAKKLFLEEEK